MNKELEYLKKEIEYLKGDIKNSDIYIKVSPYMRHVGLNKINAKKHLLEHLDAIEQALTPPTSEEVCKALSEYCNHNVEYSKEYNAFFYNFTFMNEDRMCQMAECTDNEIHIGSRKYPPHLITLIGRFYENGGTR